MAPTTYDVVLRSSVLVLVLVLALALAHWLFFCTGAQSIFRFAHVPDPGSAGSLDGAPKSTHRLAPSPLPRPPVIH